jgi:hypothetical protein
MFAYLTPHPGTGCLLDPARDKGCFQLLFQITPVNCGRGVWQCWATCAAFSVRRGIPGFHFLGRGAWQCWATCAAFSVR